MATYKSEKEFIENVIGRSLLDDSIEWIAKNMEPDDVFSQSALETWAESNGYKKDDE